MAHLAGLAVSLLAVLSPAAPAAATSGTVPSADDVRVYEGQYFNTCRPTPCGARETAVSSPWTTLSAPPRSS